MKSVATADLGEPGVIRVATSYTDQDRMTQVPGARFDKMRGDWKVPLSWASCQVLRGVFGTDLAVGEKLKAWSWDYYQHTVVPAMQLREAMELDQNNEISKAIDIIEATN
jgi:hypothetical protein